MSIVESTAAPRKRKPPGQGSSSDLEIVIFDGGALRRVPLPMNADVTIGRGEEATIRVEDPSVSRVHARFRGASSSSSSPTSPATVEDLGSSNGTRVAGQDLTASTPYPIEADTMIVIGELSVVVREVRGPEAPPPPSLPEGSMADVHRLVALVAPSDLSVLVIGETGVGKEIVSRSIHEKSARAKGPLVILNCAALPEQTLESELFGHEKGAFTGAQNAKPGLLESGDKGTVLLDEVGEMPLAIQAKVLRALDAREILRLGALKPRTIDIRVVAATNRDLGTMVEEGTFRADLLYRLDGMTIHVPPLRDRKEEIRGLVERFVKEIAERSGGKTLHDRVVNVSTDAMKALEAHAWPGNVRELRKVVERALVLAAGGDVEAKHVVLRTTSTSGPSKAAPVAAPIEIAPAAAAAAATTTLHDERARAEIDAINEALAACNGNQTRAAAKLGIGRRTLIERLDRYGIARPRKT